MINTNPIGSGPQGATTSGGMFYTEGAPTGANSTPAGAQPSGGTSTDLTAFMTNVPGYSYGAGHEGDVGGAKA